ncbi:Tetratricopeptide TPR_2 repeat-containing protein [Solidesulfovibrio carbinoliphilus subsp. oakridgensis]|uniref:Tetratricopeptide TPR_2 repeat-containing protein n=1 Tax=Solidesulfovibrio carbinoliphilus subsp. oakridgensis TaxID=694327 RepID=G7Q9S2_9BACT|nr:tetratricopeptide repeat protein [Solidesulfovibrio carbinoliphilus]EHJ49188.1 Tetratricopeptide TPR_2 repeat-containing protein [Solidesulfovibrio carbinoliphilus subsp. oakridgensis]
MAQTFRTDRFAVAVSLRESYKTGFGGTTTESERILYYYAEKTPESGIQVQALNANSVPSGEKTVVAEAEFFERYKPEPLIYYNQVKPRMEAMLAELAKGEKHLEAGRTDKAEAAFGKALAYDAENLRAIFGLGNAYLTAGKMEEAREIFEKIMSLDLAFGPENKFLFNEFGIRMRKHGLLDMARAYYEKALAASEADENLHFNLGRIHFERGNFAEAVVEADRCLAINPGFIIAAKLKRAAEKAARAAPAPPADPA